MKNNSDLKIAIVSSSFWSEIVTALENDCIKTLMEAGVKEENIEIIRVPGSFEIPLAAKKIAQTKKHDAIITFGAIHKGKTYHFELIANECARACMNLTLEFQIPVIFMVLAVYDIQDAIDRTKDTKDNRGIEAAHAALQMIKVLEKIQ